MEDPQGPQPSHRALLGTDLRCCEFEKQLPIGSLRAPKRLLARIFVKNIWHINRNKEIAFDRETIPKTIRG